MNNHGHSIGSIFQENPIALPKVHEVASHLEHFMLIGTDCPLFFTPIDIVVTIVSDRCAMMIFHLLEDDRRDILTCSAVENLFFALRHTPAKIRSPVFARPHLPSRLDPRFLIQMAAMKQNQ